MFSTFCFSAANQSPELVGFVAEVDREQVYDIGFPPADGDTIALVLQQFGDQMIDFSPIIKGDIPGIRALLQKYPQHQELHNRALLDAVRSGNIDAAKTVLDFNVASANTFEMDESGTPTHTALSYAMTLSRAKQGDYDPTITAFRMTRLLLSRGASPQRTLAVGHKIIS